MMEKANKTIQRAENSVNENSSEEAREKLEEARNAFEDGDYFEARRMATEARSEARARAFSQLSGNEVIERAREDREDFRETTNEIRETNQEMAQELQEAESEEERREIVREYREERTDLIKDSRENRENDSERRDRQERDLPNRTSSRLRMRLDGTNLDVDATLVGSSGGYTVDKSLNAGNGEINGEINFMSPDGPATAVMTEYETDIERNLEEGDYSVELELKSDGEVRENISDSITVPGDVEIERKTNGMEAGDNTVELKGEDENENESEEPEQNRGPN